MTLFEPHIEELDYRADSATRFALFAELPWAGFLDSGRPLNERGRYDILVAEPSYTLRTIGSRTWISSVEEKSVSESDPFELVGRYLPEPIERHSELPFLGGALGYFSYDLGRRLEKIEGTAQADNAMPDMAIGIYPRAIVVDHELEKSWFVDAGNDRRARDHWLKKLSQVESVPAVAAPPGFEVLSVVKPEISKEQYAQAFSRIKQHIVDGDCYQVNYAQRFSAAAKGDAWDAYCWLRKLNPAPFAAFFRIPEGAVLSSSPERFLSLRAGLAQAKPIKGTRPRGETAQLDEALARDLFDSVKDRAENVMIVDLLRNDLGRICETGSVRVPELFGVESYQTVHHLVSTVEANLPANSNACDLLRACFPGGSITGAPKVRAMQIIDALESHRRGVYCGSLGYISQCGTMDTNIAIRTLTVEQDRMLCWAGGGIVHDSTVDAEYQESLDKAAAMLALFRRTETRYVGLEDRG